MAEEQTPATPATVPTTTPSEPKKVSVTVWKALAFFGMGSAAITAVIALFTFLGTGEQIRRANQHAADLLTTIGKAQERNEQLAQRQAKLDAELVKYENILDWLDQSDPDRVIETLQLLRSPEAIRSLDLHRLEGQIRMLQRDQMFIFESAYWSHAQARNNPNALRNCLSEYWPRRRSVARYNMTDFERDIFDRSFRTLQHSVVLKSGKKDDGPPPFHPEITPDMVSPTTQP